MRNDMWRRRYENHRSLLGAIRRPGRPLSIVGALLVVGCTLVLAAGAYNRRPAHLPIQPKAVVQPVSASVQSKAVPLGSELITIQPFGFEPREITRPVGPFLLRIDNRSGMREVNLRLDQSGGDRLLAERVPWEKLDWKDVVDLLPGTYLLTEGANPTWSCKITITEP